MKRLKNFWYHSKLSKILISSLGIIFLLLLVSFTSNMTFSENLTKAQSENESLLQEIDKSSSDLGIVQSQLNEKTEELKTLQADYDKFKEEMEPYTDLSEEEAKNKTHEEKVAREEREQKEKDQKEKEKQEKQKQEERKKAEKKAEEEQQEKELKEKEELEKQKQAEEEELEKQKQAEEEAIGYNTGLTYENLARNPDDHIGEKVTFYGRVLQVMEDDGFSQLRLAVNDDYNNILLVELTDDMVTDGRILEDDEITVMGVSFGLYEYTATLGQNITIPAVIADKIER